MNERLSQNMIVYQIVYCSIKVYIVVSISWVSNCILNSAMYSKLLYQKNSFISCFAKLRHQNIHMYYSHTYRYISYSWSCSNYERISIKSFIHYDINEIEKYTWHKKNLNLYNLNSWLLNEIIRCSLSNESIFSSKIGSSRSLSNHKFSPKQISED